MKKTKEKTKSKKKPSDRLKINGSFEEVIKVAVRDNPAQNTNANKNQN